MKNSQLILVKSLLLASTAWADRIPDLNNSYATCAYQGPGYAALLVVPILYISVSGCTSLVR